MYFELGRNDNGYPTPVLTNVGHEADVSPAVFEKLRSFEGIDESSARALVDLLNVAMKSSYDRGFDGGYANGIGAGRRLERAGE